MGAQRIMLVEDNEDDVFFMRRALKEARIETPLTVMSDGEVAVQYLAGEAPYNNRSEHPLPSMILLDLKLPRKSGLEVLEWIGGEKHLRAIVVIVLTSSKHVKDIDAAARLGANSFLVKPPDVANLGKLMSLCRLYWLEHDHIALRSPD